MEELEELVLCIHWGKLYEGCRITGWEYMVEEGCMEDKGVDFHLWRSVFGGMTKFDLVRERKR